MRRSSGVAALLLVAGLAAWVFSGAGPWLALQHRVQSVAKRFSVVTTVRIEGAGEFRMFLNPEDHVLTPMLWADGIWEANETRWVVNSLRPGDVFVDVGANLGYYTVLAAKLVGETGRVYAFEPDPVNFGILEQNVRLNRLDNVVLEEKAVSNEQGTIQLFLAESNKGDHRIFQPKGEGRKAVDVEAVSLDAYFDGVEESVDFVKVDTQGAEGVILEGMVDLIRHSDDLVMAFEYSPNALAGMGYTGAQLLAALRGLQFRMFDLGMGGPDIQPTRPITARQLLRRYSPRTIFFTNLLLVKQRPDVLERLRADAGRSNGHPSRDRVR